jgi:fucose permease
MVVMGFGLGAFVYNNLLKATSAFAGVGTIMTTFVASGVVYAVLGGLCAAQLRDPPPGWTPARAMAASTPSASVRAAAGRDYPPSDAMRTPQFWALFTMLFLNVTAGILFISNAVPIMRELTGASAEVALSVYGFIALFNGLGRFFWGAVSDRVGRNGAYLLIYGSQVVIFFVVGGVHSLVAVAALFAIVLLCYGGGFGTMPSFTADYFGTKYLGANYGWVLLAWGVGGVVGPIFVAVVKDRTGSFLAALPVTAGMLVAATAIPLVTRRPGEERPFWRGLLPHRSP